MLKRTGMTVSQVTDEVLYTGLIEMQKLDAQGMAQGPHKDPTPIYTKQLHTFFQDHF